MVLLRRNGYGKTFAHRRLGQAQQGLMQQQQPMVRTAAQNQPIAAQLVQQANPYLGDESLSGPANDFDVAALNAVPISDASTIDQAEQQLDVNLNMGEDAVGNRIIEIVDESAPAGQQAEVLVNLPPAQPAPQPEVCEFPAQSVQFQRQVVITNTPPQIQNIDTDICGNVVGYTELMTRNMTASAWVPTTPAQLTGPVGNFVVNGGQMVVDQANQNVRLVNSLSVPQGATVTSQQRVGRARPVHMMNRNASYGASLMTKWRSA